MNEPYSKYIFLILFLFVSLFLFTEPSYSANDEENCLLCHKYEGLKIIDDNDQIKSFYVNNEEYNNSIHKKAYCRGCHTNITEIPHKKSDKKVNCGILCHLKTAIFKKSYSHVKIYDSFMTGAHGIPGDDTADCLYCHPKSMVKGEGKRNRLEILVECSKCHIDDERMSTYGFPPGIVKSYRNSIHSKIFFLEQKSGAICIDCHSIHNIASKADETSPINEKNLFKTCAGNVTNIRGCHLTSNPDFIFSFDHEKNKEAGITTAIKVKNRMNYLIIGLFYLFCIINIFRIIRE